MRRISSAQRMSVDLESLRSEKRVSVYTARAWKRNRQKKKLRKLVHTFNELSSWYGRYNKFHATF